MSDNLQNDPKYAWTITQVTWLAMAAQKYAEHLGVSQKVANHEVATNWSVGQAKRYVETGKLPGEE